MRSRIGKVSDMDRIGESSTRAVPPVSKSTRVETKRRKGRAVRDPRWEDALRENIAGVDASSERRGEEEQNPREKTEGQAETTRTPLQNDEQRGRKEDFEALIEEIKKMADHPEKLLDSHSSIFTEPVPPGKWVDSQG